MGLGVDRGGPEAHNRGMLSSFGVPELLIVLAIVLLLFGASRLPALARSLGESRREFKRGSEEPTDSAKTGS